LTYFTVAFLEKRNIGGYMPKATVYYFKRWDMNVGQMVPSKRMATLKAIKDLGGVPLMETAKEVDASELDGNGFYPKK
jgi:hypothetical protein